MIDPKTRFRAGILCLLSICIVDAGLSDDLKASENATACRVIVLGAGDVEHEERVAAIHKSAQTLGCKYRNVTQVMGRDKQGTRIFAGATFEEFLEAFKGVQPGEKLSIIRIGHEAGDSVMLEHIIPYQVEEPKLHKRPKPVANWGEFLTYLHTLIPEGTPIEIHESVCHPHVNLDLLELGYEKPEAVAGVCSVAAVDSNELHGEVIDHEFDTTPLEHTWPNRTDLKNPLSLKAFREVAKTYSQSTITNYYRPPTMVGMSLTGPSKRDMSKGPILTSFALMEEFLKAPFKRCSLAEGVNSSLGAKFRQIQSLRYESQLPTYQAHNQNIFNLLSFYFGGRHAKALPAEMNSSEVLSDEIDHLKQILAELPGDKVAKDQITLRNLEVAYQKKIPARINSAPHDKLFGGELWTAITTLKRIHNNAYEIEVERSFYRALDELVAVGGCQQTDREQILNLLRSFQACEARSFP